MKTLTRILAAWFLLLVAAPAAEEKAPWWNKAWTIRKQITIDTAAISEPIGATAVLLRLHEGNFQFLNGKDDGSDLRFVAADGKTVLAHHVEKFDSLMNEAFVWVKTGELKPGEKTNFWLYYGNTGNDAVKAENAKETFDAETVLVYHFAERGGPANDSTGNAITAQNEGLVSDGAQIGGGLRFDGKTAVTIPAAPALAWTAGGKVTISAWVKLTTLQPGAVIFSRRDGGSGLVIGFDSGAPFIEVNGQRSAPGAVTTANTWRHLAVVGDGAKFTLYLDGEVSTSLAAPLPALNGPIQLGRDGETAPGFTGELDELQIAKTARSAGFVKFASISQGSGDAAGKLLVFAADEATVSGGGSAALEHVMLFGDIAKNMMFDGWIAVGACVVMMFFGWTVALQKFGYLNSIQKGSETFLEQWKQLSSDLTALDHDDEESVKSLGGNADAKTLRNLHRSPLYHLYQIGSEEIRHRVSGDRNKGLSARSIQAIRASLESGLVRENQRMHKGLIFLTISIAGGPYVGLLGTVVGVMITFAIIAKHGEVDVNSIAPGIASALLATVFGLFVAIPALFIYSYLSSRIKDLLAAMQVFIDEFIAKMAEFYPTPADGPAAHLSRDTSPATRQPELEASRNHAS